MSIQTQKHTNYAQNTHISKGLDRRDAEFSIAYTCYIALRFKAKTQYKTYEDIDNSVLLISVY